MGKYHVACGLAGIYAGELKKGSNDEWKDRALVTDEAIAAVRDWMFDEFNNGKEVFVGSHRWRRKDGRIVQLALIVTSDKNDSTVDNANEVPHGVG